MHKTLIIAAVALSGVVLTSLGLPQAKAAHKTVSVAHAEASKPFSDTLNWKLLGQIKYIKKPSKDYPEGVMYPIINTQLKAKQGKQVVMTGFVVPIDNKSYALSKNVFASCFFCGKAGPETIMGIKMKEPMRFKTDQYVT
ncbi:MAG: hypothetical protein ACOVRN_04515, partial [Flavobacterium sp.]